MKHRIKNSCGKRKIDKLSIIFPAEMAKKNAKIGIFSVKNARKISSYIMTKLKI